MTPRGGTKRSGRHLPRASADALTSHKGTHIDRVEGGVVAAGLCGGKEGDRGRRGEGRSEQP